MWGQCQISTSWQDGHHLSLLCWCTAMLYLATTECQITSDGVILKLSWFVPCQNVRQIFVLGRMHGFIWKKGSFNFSFLQHCLMKWTFKCNLVKFSFFFLLGAISSTLEQSNSDSKLPLKVCVSLYHLFLNELCAWTTCKKTVQNFKHKHQNL